MLNFKNKNPFFKYFTNLMNSVPDISVNDQKLSQNEHNECLISAKSHRIEIQNPYIKVEHIFLRGIGLEFFFVAKRLLFASSMGARTM